MELVKFMNTHKENCIDLLQGAPYFIKVKKQGDYYVMKYNQLESDMSLQIVQECRGCIVKWRHDHWDVVCHPMDKFFNIQEQYAHQIDWASASVLEKVDGSIIKVWCDRDTLDWKISTNGMANAFEAPVSDCDLTFGQLVLEAVDMRALLKELDYTHTYYFELVSPMARLVVPYSETKLYYLGERDLITDKELYCYTDFMEKLGVLCPGVYPLGSAEACLEVAKGLGKDKEGFVVRDKYFNRVKIKGEAYLAAFKMRGNNMFTMKKVVEAMRGDYVDDFKACCPDWSDKIDEVVNEVVYCARRLDEVREVVLGQEYETQKDYAAEVKKLDKVYWGFLFQARKFDLKGKDYLDKMTVDKLVDYVKEVV